MHWSGGGIGYFPTYALGNVISLQIWAKVREALPDLDDADGGRRAARSSPTGCATTSTRWGRKLTPKETLGAPHRLGRDRPAAVPRLPGRQDGAARSISSRPWSPSSEPSEILDDVTERVLAEVPAGAVLFDAHTHLGDDIDGMRGRPDEMLAMFDRVGIVGVVHVLPRRARPRARRSPPRTTARSPTPRRAPTGSSRSCGSTSTSARSRRPNRCLDLGARGIKLHPRAQKFSLGDERLDAVFALAVERDVPILIHGGRGLPPIGDHLAALVDRYAGVRLIIAHAGIADLGGLAGHFAHVPGVFFDTSVWSIVDLLDLMRQVAPQQILFATDYPYGRLPNALLLALRAARLVALRRGRDPRHARGDGARRSRTARRCPR